MIIQWVSDKELQDGEVASMTSTLSIDADKDELRWLSKNRDGLNQTAMFRSLDQCLAQLGDLEEE